MAIAASIPASPAPLGTSALGDCVSATLPCAVLTQRLDPLQRRCGTGSNASATTRMLLPLSQDGVSAMRHAQYSGNAPIRCSGGAARSRSDQWVALRSRLPTPWRCAVRLGAPPEAEPVDASGGAWKRLATPGSDWGALGSAWGAPGSVWGAPRSARRRLGAPGQRLGAPGNASGTPGNASGRLDAPGGAWGALGSALGFAFSTVWQRLGSAEERLERLGGARQPLRLGSAQKHLETPVAAVAALVPRLGAPGGRLGRAWRLGTLGSRSTAWAAPGPRLRRA